MALHLRFMASLLLVALLAPCASARQPGPLRHSSQLMVVQTGNWNAVTGYLYRYERASARARWTAVGRPIPVVVGHSGMAWGRGILPAASFHLAAASDPVKREGDGRSPAGLFQMGTAFGTSQSPLQGMKLAYQTLTPTIECVDDTNSRYYNLLLDRSQVSPDWHSNEEMLKEQPYYHWGAVILNNAQPVLKGSGSCIFMHIWGRPGEGTLGCTAMAVDNLTAVLPWIDPARKPLLLQLPEAEYATLRSHWSLPELSSAQPAGD